MGIGQSHLDCPFASCWQRDGWGQGKVFFRRMPSLEKVNECLPSSPASAFALRDSFDSRRENDKVVELSEGQPLSCWRMTLLSALFKLINF